MPQLIQFLADTLGIEYGVIEGSVATLAFLLVAFLLKLLWAASKRDDKQLDLEGTLASLAMRILKSYDNNTEAIERLKDVLEGIKLSFIALGVDIKTVAKDVTTLHEKADSSRPVLDNIQTSIDKIANTTVIIKDGEDNVIATLQAKPDESGNLVVVYKKLKDTEDIIPLIKPNESTVNDE